MCRTVRPASAEREMLFDRRLTGSCHTTDGLGAATMTVVSVRGISSFRQLVILLAESSRCEATVGRVSSVMPPS